MPPRRAPRSRRNCRRIIRSSLAPGRPRACRRRRSGSRLPKTPSARSLSAPKEPVSSSSFIAAARRAAQAAAAAPPPEKAGRSAKAKDKGDKAKGGDKGRKDLLQHFLQDALAAGRRERGRDRARHVQDGDDAARHRQRAANAGDGTARRTGRPGAGPDAPESSAKPAMPAAPAPMMISPTPVEKQSNNSSAPNTLDSARIAVPPEAAPPPAAANDITGTITMLRPLAASRHDRGASRPSGCRTVSAARCCASSAEGRPGRSLRSVSALPKARRSGNLDQAVNGTIARRRPALCRRSSGSAPSYEKGLA